MMVLYVSNQSRSLCDPTSVGPSKSISRDKKSLFLDDLLQRIDDNMFDNQFVYQHRFDYSKPGENEDDETLDTNVIVNVDNDVDDEIIPLVPEFINAYGSSFVVSHDWVLSHKQTFSSKNKLVNVVKRWHIAHSIEYRVQWSNSIFVQLQCVQAPECKWYLHGGIS